MKTALGPLQRVVASTEQFDATFEQGDLHGGIELDEEGRFVRLDLDTPRMRQATFEETIARLRALPGQVSVLVVDDGVDRLTIDADVPHAVGTAAWMAILSAVRQKIGASGDWSRILRLKASARSAGGLADWPDGSPLTVFSLAALMNVQHDPTAADTLLDWVGRAAVEQQAPESRPFLSAREALALDARENVELRRRCASADEGLRRAALAELEQHMVSAKPRPLVGPYHFGIAWRSTARRLCDHMRQVRDLPMMSIHAAAGPSPWERLAHVEGLERDSSTEVTWLDGGGHSRCVAAIWDSPEVTPGRLEGLHAQLIGSIGSP